MSTPHGAAPSAPLLTMSEARLIEAGIARGTVAIALALADAEQATLLREAIQAHRRECDEMTWSDIDQAHIQPLEGRLTARLAPVEVGRTAPRSPFAQPPKVRPFWRVSVALAVIAGAVLVIGATDLLRAAWAAWGGAR